MRRPRQIARDTRNVFSFALHRTKRAPNRKRPFPHWRVSKMGMIAIPPIEPQSCGFRVSMSFKTNQWRAVQPAMLSNFVPDSGQPRLDDASSQLSYRPAGNDPHYPTRRKRRIVQTRYALSVSKPLILTLLLSLMAAAQASPATTPPQASTPNSAGAQPQARPQGQEKSIDDELQLSPDQKQKIAAIVDDERKQMNALRDNASLSMDQKQQKATEIRQVGAPKIRAILTQEQLQKLAAIQQREQQTPANSNQGPPQPPAQH
jgi:Spy/CpxP family protein refolding chaperone